METSSWTSTEMEFDPPPSRSGRLSMRKGFAFRRLIRFKLKTLLVLTTLVCLFLGLHMRAYWRQKAALENLRSHGVYVSYRYPEWRALRRYVERVGEDHFLTPITVTGSRFTTEGRELVGLRHLYDIEELHFTDTGFTSNVLSLLGSRRDLKRFELLRKNGPPSDDGAALELLGECTELERVFLRNVAVPANALTSLRNCPNLRVLMLWNTTVADTDVRLIRELRTLEGLSLRYSEITDTGLRQLTELEELKVLDIGGTKISNDGLMQLRKLPKLHSLSLSDTRISDEGLKHLAALHDLKSVGLQGTAVTPEGAEWLRDELGSPCRVIR